MTKKQIDFEKKNFVVDILSCSADKAYIHAYVHRKNGNKDCSFNIVTSPEMLFYYGDVGCFTFERYGQKNMLFFFNAEEPNYPYWAEKCKAGKVYEYDSETAKKSFLTSFADKYDIDYDDSTDMDKLYDKVKAAISSDTDSNADADYFENLYDGLDDEYCLGDAFDYLSDNDIEYDDFYTQKYTEYFDRCLNNLAIFSGVIIDKIKA